ncbi:MAG: HemK family protein methyltransferase, partial [Alphaproteobacteria bacterium]|nr:HemK family protein methyltransferase [Alphaproteobacteria bacterium]
MDTVAIALAAATRRLAASGLAQPRFEARVLLSAALEADGAAILGYPERVLTPGQADRLADFVRRRAAREPSARLIGRREFWSLDFRLSPDTLVPRPDSETLIEAALAAIANRAAPLRILDFGTGTGCLLLALLSELPAASGIGVDIAPGAVETARENAAALGLAGRASFFVGSWADAILQGFDVILANPPYIESG